MSTTNKPNDVRVSMAQVFKAVEYANDHPDRYLSGTTNWCAAVSFALNRQIIDAQPDDKQGEPAGYRHRVKGHDNWTHTGCKVEFDSRNNDDRFVAERLYRQAQTATVKVDERAEFDKWTVSQGRVVGYGGWHRDLQVWQARAKLNGDQS